MAAFICVIITLRLFFWLVFPQYGMGLNSEIMFVAWSLLAIALYVAGKMRNVLRWPTIWFLIAMGISLLVSKEVTKTALFTMSFSLYTILFVAAATWLKMRDQIKYACYAVFFIAFIVAAKSIQEASLLFHPGIFIEGGKLVKEYGRSFSYMGWPTASASVMLLALPFMFFAAIERRRWFWTALAVLLMGFLATKSLMPTASLVLALGLALMHERRFERIITPLIVTSLILGLIVAWRGGVSQTFDTRLAYLDAGIKEIVAHPWIGSGAGTFVYSGQSPTIYVHNSFIQIWAELGVIGFASMGFIVRGLWITKPGESLVERGIYWGLVAFLIDNLTNFTLLRYTTSIYFWVLLGCYFGLKRRVV